MSTPPPQYPVPGPGHSWPPPAPQQGWGPTGYHPRPELNGFALGSLLVGLLCFPPLGIVFAIVALVQIGKKRERGKALAIVGLVVSGVLTLGMGAVVVAGQYGDAVFGRLGAARSSGEAEGELTAIDDMRTGDCFNVPDGDMYDDSSYVYAIGCAQVHDGEVTSSTVLHGTAYPGSEQLRKTATDTCWTSMDEYAMDTWALPGHAEMFHFSPSAASWRQGDRRLVCVIGTPDEEQRGSLRKDAGMLTQEQVDFLRVMNAADQALGREPEEEPDRDMDAHRRWAREVEGALGGQVRVLEGAKGRPGVGGPAGARLKELAAARREWRTAAGATRPAEFDVARRRAGAALSLDAEKALRGAYGLSTTVPDWATENPSDGPGGAGGGPSAEAVTWGRRGTGE
ncbi:MULTISPECIES: DUF4190 domain-containing protein [unclassified Streptomyces]|uniref:DUF4190 domain-containing protein n=1 Tax=unclassified Streptomyces TaxID=2593676 RepID=UPI002256C289|nr:MULTISPECIES: DUF4190 domain-containing protein [unclassified Streptomyces]MCX4527854.1 DUF4190 domain-containing protein [Streptomyces sp. NBC_01551]MCX4541549.1 DUF4190 domain-containing protein [Streptomyces sp. NBC_01565]